MTTRLRAGTSGWKVRHQGNQADNGRKQIVEVNSETDREVGFEDRSNLRC